MLASFGISFPAITLIANWRGIHRDDADAMRLARRWSKVMAVLFAVGAVTGTMLSFELGLLWPGLMERYGSVFGIPFAYEGLFFFTEAIFIAIYIYGWDRMKPRAHFWAGVPIAIAGVGGTLAVVAANSWMNQPGGFTQATDGTVTSVSPLTAIFNRAMWYEVPHMLLAGYAIGGFGVASVYAVAMLRGRRDRHHRLGLLIPLVVASIVMPVQMLVGDTAARAVFHDQPVKFAAMELVPQTSSDVPESIGGVLVDGEVRGDVPIPGLASILAGFSTSTVIQGLDSVPPQDQPPANVVHLAFDVMVGLGSALFLLALWFAVVWWRRRDLPRTALVPPLRRGVGGRGGRDDVGRVDRHRGGAPALDRERPPAHGGRRDLRQRPVVVVRPGVRRLRRAVRHRGRRAGPDGRGGGGPTSRPAAPTARTCSTGAAEHDSVGARR